MFPWNHWTSSPTNLHTHIHTYTYAIIIGIFRKTTCILVMEKKVSLAWVELTWQQGIKRFSWWLRILGYKVLIYIQKAKNCWLFNHYWPAVIWLKWIGNKNVCCRRSDWTGLDYYSTMTVAILPLFTLINKAAISLHRLMGISFFIRM